MIYFVATLLVIAIGVVVVWELFVAWANFVYRYDLKRRTKNDI